VSGRTFSLSLIAAVAGIGAIGSPMARAEPAKMRQAGPSGDVFKVSVRGKFLLPAKIAASSGIRPQKPVDTLASAIRPLDLRKLSMSDFGDTEPSR
jgi:hypothetical protein